MNPLPSPSPRTDETILNEPDFKQPILDALGDNLSKETCLQVGETFKAKNWITHDLRHRKQSFDLALKP